MTAPAKPATTNAMLIVHLEYLLKQYDCVVEVHSKIVMDTEEDCALHARAVAYFKEAAEPVRKLLRAEGAVS